VKPDRTYDLEIGTPTTAWLLQQAAGIRRGKQITTKDGNGINNYYIKEDTQF
jgi:ribosomal protein L11